ncbi:hypothetical protein Pst134EB_002286 [Puccinia striiformis f. sp. tritici]|nr:hypothetical protein Pst134EB_002286 [Puccinia striiformis f. sp. tritici]
MAQSTATATIDPSTLNEDLKMATDFPRNGNGPYSIVSAGLEHHPTKDEIGSGLPRNLHYGHPLTLIRGIPSTRIDRIAQAGTIRRD